MSSLAIEQINIIVTNTDCMRARMRAPSMAWRASFPRSRLPSVEFFNKASMCVYGRAPAFQTLDCPSQSWVLRIVAAGTAFAALRRSLGSDRVPADGGASAPPPPVPTPGFASGPVRRVCLLVAAGWVVSCPSPRSPAAPAGGSGGHHCDAVLCGRGRVIAPSAGPSGGHCGRPSGCLCGDGASAGRCRLVRFIVPYA